MIARWEINPNNSEEWECEELIDDAGAAIATLEVFCGRNYPWAFDPAKKSWVRGGCFSDKASAALWAERVAGLHPTKPGDDREASPYGPRGFDTDGKDL